MKLQAEDAVNSGKTSNSTRALTSSPELKTGWVGVERVSESSTGRTYVRPGFDWMAADVYLFDIDGTLLNSRDAVHYHAFHRAVEKVFGLDLRLDGIAVHGNTDVGILRAYLEVAGVPENEWMPRLPEMLEIMSSDVERNVANLRPELCPAVGELVRQLYSRGKLLGIASGNVESVGWAKLRACGLREYFSFGGFSGQIERREAVIAHALEQASIIRDRKSFQACLIGDTPADISAAHANSIAVIAVATGIYSVDELLPHQPEMCISCCEDLLKN